MKNYLSLIKFSHTVFALPFALVGFFLANFQTGQTPSLRTFAGVFGCMVFARSAAMAFNRYLDRDIDAQNPRTAVREIPAGIVSASEALRYVIVNSIMFIACTLFLLNELCFYLSPVALAVVLGYSYTKRFTWLCHFILGLGLSLAPIGAYLAVTGRFDGLPLLYSAVVLLWVSGFDIIYALQDDDFDKSLNLNSIPVFLGRRGALNLSNLLHLGAAAILVFAVWRVNHALGGRVTEGVTFGWIHWLGAAVFIGLLIYQHTLVKINDLSKINLAFFTTNGIASCIYGGAFVLDYFF